MSEPMVVEALADHPRSRTRPLCHTVMHPLHHAIEHMDEQAVAALLAGGADPNEPDPEAYGMRPVQHAVHAECEDSCYRYDMGDYDAAPRATLTRMLLDAGADPDLPDARGQTARDVARERMHEEALELFSRRARPETRDG